MKGQQAGLKTKIRNKKKGAKAGAADVGGKGQLAQDGTVTLAPKLSSFITGVGLLSVLGVTQRSADIERSKEERFRSGIHEDKVDVWALYRLVDPNSINKIQWDLSMGLIVVYSLVTIPFRIGFEVTVSEQVKNMEYSIDILFFIDLLVNFTTAYVNPSTGKLVVDRQKICMNYFQFWFWIDLLSTIPFDSMFESSSSNLKSVRLIRIARVMRLMRLAKLARFVKLSRLNSHFEKLDINPAVVNVFKIVFQIFFIAHLICCFWYYLTTSTVTGVVQPPESDPSYPLERTWATEFGFEHKDVLTKYIASFYWTIATMLAIGYGDIHATNNKERIYSIATMLCGGITFGMVIAQVTRLIETRNPQARAYKEKMDELKAFLGEKSLPAIVRIKAKDAYSYYLQKKSSLGDSGIFTDLPRPLLNRLIRNIYEKEVNRIEMFRHGFKRGDGSFIVNLVMKCHPLYHVRGDIVYEMGDIATSMFFIVRGRVRLLDENKSGSSAILMGYATEGNFFGELEFYQKTIRLCSVAAAYNSNLLSLNYSDLRAALEEHLDAAKHFNSTISSRYKNFQTVVGSDASQSYDEPVISSSETSLFRLDRRPSVTNLVKVVMWVNGKLELQLKTSQEDDDAMILQQDSLIRVIYLDIDTGIEVVAEESINNLGPQRHLLHPRGLRKIYWDALIGILIIYSVLIIPVQIGFSAPGNEILEHIIDIFFFLDIGFSARTSYFSEEDDAWVITPSKIYRNYLTGWFVIDLFSSIPFDFIFSSLLESSVSGLRSIKLLKTLRLTRLLKLVRLVKLGKYINQLEDIFGISPSAFDLLKMVCEVIFIGHLVACTWWGLCDLLTKETWFDNPAMVYDSLREAPLSTKYITSLYWTFTTLATVGYGDITAINSSERIVAIFIMILGATVFGYIVANVSALMGTLNQTEVKNNEKIAEVTEYLNEKNCPKMLAGAIIRHNKFKLHEQSAFDEDAIYSRLPHRISDEIQLFQYNELMNKIPICKREYISNQSIRLFIFKSLESLFFDTNQYIVQEGEIADSIFFIVSGRAMVYVKGEKKLRVKKRSTAEVFSVRKKKFIRTRIQTAGDNAKDWIKDKAVKAINAAKHMSSRDLVRDAVKDMPTWKIGVMDEEGEEEVDGGGAKPLHSESSSGNSSGSSSSSGSDDDVKKDLRSNFPSGSSKSIISSSAKLNSSQGNKVSSKYEEHGDNNLASTPSNDLTTAVKPSVRVSSPSNSLMEKKSKASEPKDFNDLDDFLSNDTNFAPLQKSQVLEIGRKKLYPNLVQPLTHSQPFSSVNSENDQYLPAAVDPVDASIKDGKMLENSPASTRLTRKSLRGLGLLTPNNPQKIGPPQIVRQGSAEGKMYRPSSAEGKGRPSSAEFKTKVLGSAHQVKNLDHLKNSSDEDEDFITTNNITDDRALYSIMDNRMQNRGYRPMGEVMQGDIVGYSAFLRRSRHLASIRAVEPCSVYALSWKAIETLLQTQPSVGLDLQMALGLAIAAMEQDIGRLYSKKLRANFLTRQKTKHVSMASAAGGPVHKASAPIGFKPLRHAVSVAGPAWGGVMNAEHNIYHQGGNGGRGDVSQSYLSRASSKAGSLMDNIAIPKFREIKFKPIETIKNSATGAMSYLKSKIYPDSQESPMRLRPDSKWHIVRKAVRDAKITSAIASMSENANNSGNHVSSSSISSGSPKKKNLNFSKAMLAKVGVRRIDQLLNEETINYNSDDDVFANVRDRSEDSLELGSKNKSAHALLHSTSAPKLGILNNANSLLQVGLLSSSVSSSAKLSAGGEDTATKMYIIKRSKLRKCRSSNDLLTVAKEAHSMKGPFSKLEEHHNPNLNHNHNHNNAAAKVETLKRRVSFPSLEVEAWRSGTKMKICV